MSLTQVQDVSVEDICMRKKPQKHYVYFIHVHWQNGLITPVYRSYSTLLELQERLLRIEDFLSKQKDGANTGTLLKKKSFTDKFTIKKRAKALRRMPVVEEFLKSVIHCPPHISGSDPVINFFHPLPEDLMEQAQTFHSMEKQGTKSKYIHHISEPFLLEQYVAISDYTKREDSDISLKAGNVVDVIERNEHGWWFVDLDSELGWVPASYLEPRDGSMDDQILETFEEGEEETYIAIAAYEPQLEDEVGFEMGRIVKVIQKNLDGWWFVKLEEQEGWAPSMFLREIASSQHNARQKGKHAAVRAMLRDTRLNSISVLAGRRQTWDPPARKKSVKRNIPGHGGNQAREDSFTSKPARSYVNLEFHEVKRPAARRNPRQKQDPNEVRAGCRFGKELNSVKQNPENSANGMLGDRLVKPRPLSLVQEEGNETVSRGTSPIPSPLLRRDSKGSSSAHFSFEEPVCVRPSESPDEEANMNDELSIQEIEISPAPEFASIVTDSHSDKKEEQEIEQEDEDEGEVEVEDDGEEYTENMPELVNNNRFYAMGSYKKEEEQEVNLRENAEVEVLEESEGGWWLVRTSSHSVGWAPSNFLEKVQSIKGSVRDGSGKDLPEDYIEVIPIRPPKSPRVLKMAQDMCIEKKFWYYIQKGKDVDTCPLDEKDGKPQNTSDLTTRNNKPTSDAKENNNDIMTFTFDDFECDPDSGLCKRKSTKSAGVKYVPRNNVPDNGHLQVECDVPGVLERSESVPSLAESEDFDDLPSD
ncbi:hypothetical protein ACROYT_G009733 [Oculina patagonica]